MELGPPAEFDLADVALGDRTVPEIRGGCDSRLRPSGLDSSGPGKVRVLLQNCKSFALVRLPSQINLQFGRKGCVGFLQPMLESPEANS
jgi:hypothetical protein